MNNRAQLLALWMAVLLVGLEGGCSPGAHSTASRPANPDPPANPGPPANPDPSTYVAQAPTCWDSMSCCIQKHPLTPVASCGADPFEAARILEDLGMVDAAKKLTTLKGVDVPERGEERDDGEERPDWNQYCRDEYTRCVDLKWTGSCSDCLQRCLGQRGKWPSEMCKAPAPRRRR